MLRTWDNKYVDDDDDDDYEETSAAAAETLYWWTSLDIGLSLICYIVYTVCDIYTHITGMFHVILCEVMHAVPSTRNTIISFSTVVFC